MLYRIEYADGKCRNFANSRKDLLEWLKLLKDETITDIRKIYKSGVSDSVLEKYMKYWFKNRILDEDNLGEWFCAKNSDVIFFHSFILS